ncbi:MAG: hypothetical protein Q9173_003183 [Seirophora scorigena]
MRSTIAHSNIFGDHICASVLNTTEGYTPTYTLKSTNIQLLSFFTSESLEQDQEQQATGYPRDSDEVVLGESPHCDLVPARAYDGQLSGPVLWDLPDEILLVIFAGQSTKDRHLSHHQRLPEVSKDSFIRTPQLRILDEGARLSTCDNFAVISHFMNDVVVQFSEEAEKITSAGAQITLFHASENAIAHFLAGKTSKTLLLQFWAPLRILYAAAFYDEDVMGVLMHPHRGDYPQDYQRYWRDKVEEWYWDYSHQRLVTYTIKQTDKGEEETVTGLGDWLRHGHGWQRHWELWPSWDPREFSLINTRKPR